MESTTQAPKSIYSVMFFEVRDALGLKDIEYYLLDGLCKLSEEGANWCWATVKYFSGLYGVTQRHIQRTLSSLVKKGFVELKKISCKITHRRPTKKALGSFLAGIKMARQGFDPKPILGYNSTKKEDQKYGGPNVTQEESKGDQMSPKRVTKCPKDSDQMSPYKHSYKHTDKQSVNAHTRESTHKASDLVQTNEQHINASPKKIEEGQYTWQQEAINHFYKDKTLRAERVKEGWKNELVQMLLKWLQVLHTDNLEIYKRPLKPNIARGAISEIREWILSSKYPIDHIKEQIQACTDNSAALSTFKDRCRDRLMNFKKRQTHGTIEERIIQQTTNVTNRLYAKYG